MPGERAFCSRLERRVLTNPRRHRRDRCSPRFVPRQRKERSAWLISLIGRDWKKQSESRAGRRTAESLRRHHAREECLVPSWGESYRGCCSVQICAFCKIQQGAGQIGETRAYREAIYCRASGPCNIYRNTIYGDRRLVSASAADWFVERRRRHEPLFPLRRLP